MQNYYFPDVEKLQEMVKTYHILKSFTNVSQLKQDIDALRLKIAIDALQRMNYFAQINVPQRAANQTQDIFYTSDDIKSLMKRAIASLDIDVTIALTHQGERRSVFTREQVAWQQVFSDIQEASTIDGQQLPFDFPAELFFNENESLNFSVTNQSDAAGFIFPHGCNLIDNRANIDKVQQEINENEYPESQLVPLIYKFTGAANTYAVNPQGESDIYSDKSDRSVILTHVSVTGVNCRLSLSDTGRNQEFCNLVEMRGVAGFFSSQYTVYYPLPYPHLLMKKDRLRARVLNGSDITGTAQAQNVFNYLTFYGFTL